MPDHPFIVGICGLAGAGKSTFAAALAKRLRESHSLDAEIIPFARPLKDGLAAMGIEKAAHPELYRVAAQQLGTDIVRKRHPDWWCDQFRKAVAYTPRMQLIGNSLGVLQTKCSDIDTGSVMTVPDDPDGYTVKRCDVIIADDVRFENEVRTIRNLGGVMVYIDAADRLGLVRRRRIFREESRFHWRLKRSGIHAHKSEDLAASWWRPYSWWNDNDWPMTSDVADYCVDGNYDMDKSFHMDLFACDVACTAGCISKRTRK